MRVAVALSAGVSTVTGAASTAADPRPRVVATHSILGDWVAAVVGSEVSVDVLVGPDGDGHTYEPTPQDALRIKEADLVFFTGVHFEPWLDDLLRTCGAERAAIDLSEGVILRDTSGRRGTSKTLEQDQIDPHYWNDVRNAAQAVRAIERHAAARLPERAEEFKRRSADYRRRLEALDRWVVEQAQSVPPARRKLVTAHDSIGYWADRVGYRVVGTAFGSVTTEAADPSARDIRRLVDGIRAEKVSVVFAENIGGDRLVERIAREAGVRLAPKLHTDALSRPDGPAATYIDLMRANTSTIVESLRRE